MKYAIMIFESEIESGFGTHPNKLINSKNLYFNNGIQALQAYINLPINRKYTFLISGNDDYELQCLMGEKILQYSNKPITTIT